MLFSSPVFIFLFLPCVLVLFYTLVRNGKTSYALYSLIAASLLFYAWWKPVYLILIVSSIIGNYWIGTFIHRLKSSSPGSARFFMIFGVCANLASIGYFKYANFFVDTLNTVASTDLVLHTILLPLAISFFTFQQIAYLVDVYRGEPSETSFRNYALFVTFFPQLIAGPIVHHKEMLPQFLSNAGQSRMMENLAIGFTIFSIGLLKKVIMADGAAGYADAIFQFAEAGGQPTLLEAWLGSLAYTCQLYFDFSGYSDMAVGLGRMFGIRLPLNFNSPYKARNITEFWRRWHMTLSRFLRDYLYIPLGGSRNGKFNTYRNLFLVMLLGGLWHGAGWTFILWGALHGIYLLINLGWRQWRESIGHDLQQSSWLGRVASTCLTFIAVVAAWVYFRAESVEVAHAILGGMAGLNGVSLPMHWGESFTAHISAEGLSRMGVTLGGLQSVGAMFTPVKDVIELFATAETDLHKIGTITALATLVIPLFVVFFMPNTQQIMYHYSPAFEIYPGEIKRTSLRFLEWHKTRIWAIVVAFFGAYGCFGGSGVTRFLYFNF